MPILSELIRVNPDNCRLGLIQTLYVIALENNVFAEMKVLNGTGAFEGCFETEEEEDQNYVDFINRFYRATGKHFLGDLDSRKNEKTISADNYAPSSSLTKEEYIKALEEVFFKARDGVFEAVDWKLFMSGREYELRLTYSEFLGMISGINAWDEWLCDHTNCDNEENYDVFIDEAHRYFFDDYLGSVQETRHDIDEIQDQ